MSLETGKRCVKLALGEQILSFSPPGGEPMPTASFDGKTLAASCCGVEVVLEVEQGADRTIIRKGLGPREHVFGLGTRAYPPDRRRGRFLLFNNDLYGYQLGMDPLYASIPLLVFIEGGRAFGLVVNSPAYGVADIGALRYGEVTIQVDDRPEIYVLFGPSPLDVYSTYSEVTGRLYSPPEMGAGASHISLQLRAAESRGRGGERGSAGGASRCRVSRHRLHGEV